MTPSQKDYWDRFILEWDGSVYDQDARSLSLLEKMATLYRGKLRYRTSFAQDFLTPLVHGRKILELGCGAGRFSAALWQAGAAQITGVDVSAAAIGRAQDTFRQLNTPPDACRFLVSEVESLDWLSLDFDLVVGLGILQYLRPTSLAPLFAATAHAQLFFEFHESGWSTVNALHWGYRQTKILIYKDYPFYRTLPRRELRHTLARSGHIAHYRRTRGLSFFTTCPQATASWEPM